MTDPARPPATLPLFPIRGCILLPGEALPLNVFEPRYLNMLDDAMAAEGWLGIIQPRESGPSERPDLQPVGCAGRVASFKETEDGRYLIVLEGVSRFRLAGEGDAPTPYRVAKVDYKPFEHDADARPLGAADDHAGFHTLLRRFFDYAGLKADWDSIEQAPATLVADKVAMAAPFDAAAKQALLEAEDSRTRLKLLTAMMSEALDPSRPGGAA